MSREGNRNWAAGCLIDDEIVKCGCGKVMRYREWPSHWDGCDVGEPAILNVTEANELVLQEQQR